MSCVLAIDPGTSKCGLAIVCQDEGRYSVLLQCVEETAGLRLAIQSALKVAHPSRVVIGDGTGSKQAAAIIAPLVAPLIPELVEERNTTLAARARYWAARPRRGWRLLLPKSLQLPPEPYDDFVAIILAERALNSS